MKTFFLLLFFLQLVVVCAQPSSVKSSGKMDNKDSLLLVDTLAAKQPAESVVPLNVPIHNHGVLSSDSHMSSYHIGKRDIQLQYYTTLDEIMERVVPLFPVSTGYHGQPNFFRVLGAGIRDNSLSFNGRPMNDPSYGAIQLNTFPTEFMENMEVLLGSRAVIFGDNTSGMLLNIQEPRYNVKSPYTRIWYADGANGYIASDGIFSQNIAPNLNMTLGYRRQAADGRYVNQWLDAWNLRALIRWSISSTASLSFTEIFTNHGYGSNGGVDTVNTSDINNELTANVKYPHLNQRVMRHDMSLHFSSQEPAEASSLFQATLYFTRAQWQVGRDSTLLFTADSSSVAKWSNLNAGLSARLEKTFFGHVATTVGGLAEYQSNDSSDYAHTFSRLHAAAFGHGRLFIDSLSALSGGARFQIVGDRTTLAAGAAIDIKLAKHWRLRADASQSSRLPSATEGLSLRSENTSLLFADLAWGDSVNTITILGFGRLVNNPLVARAVMAANSANPVALIYFNADQSSSYGVVLSGTARISSIVCDGSVQLIRRSLDGQSLSDIPSVYSQLSVLYQHVIGRNLLYIGFGTRVHSAFSGESFVPQQWGTLASNVDQSAATSGLDVLAGARLGDATIKIRYQNILSNSYTTLSTFPIPDRNLSISVAWTFFD